MVRPACSRREFNALGALFVDRHWSIFLHDLVEAQNAPMRSWVMCVEACSIRAKPFKGQLMQHLQLRERLQLLLCLGQHGFAMRSTSLDQSHRF